MKTLTFALIPLVLLAGCGGDDASSSGASSSAGGGSTTGPAPVPTSTGTTLLTPIARDLTGFGSSSTLALDGSRLDSVGFIYPSGSPSTRATIVAPGAYRYQLVSGFYGNITGETSLQRQSSSNDTWLDYAADVQGNKYRIRQLVAGSGNREVALLYSTLAIARAYVVNAPSTKTTYNIVPLSFGLPYVPGGTPLSRTLIYQGIVAGIASARPLEGAAVPLSTRNVYDVTGSIRLEADTVTGETKGEIRLSGRNEASGDTVNLGTYPLTSSGPIAPVSTQLRSSINAGSVSALLAGPNAEEMMGAFDTEVADPALPTAMLRIVGVSAGKR